MTNKRGNGRAGITLIEMLVVITIIALFSAVAWNRMGPALDIARRTQAEAQIGSLMAALQRYEIDKGRYPSQEQAFAVLDDYLMKEIPLDPWGNPYVYRFPGEHRPSEPQVLCYGADGQPGGEGTNEDIVSWK